MPKGCHSLMATRELTHDKQVVVTQPLRACEPQRKGGLHATHSRVLQSATKLGKFRQ
jgi:hypothetical protein